MTNRRRTISLGICITIVLVVLQSCDSKINIDEPKQFFKYIGADGDQSSVDLVVDAADNIYILGRSSSTSDRQQLYVVKTNPRGVVLWEKTFGDPGDEDPKDIEVMTDGNLVLVADRTDLASGEKDFVIYMLSSATGTMLRTAMIGGNAGIADYANSITQVTGGYIVSSYSDNGVFKSASIFRYDVDLDPDPSWDVPFAQELTVGGYDFVPFKVVQLRADLFYTFGFSNTILDGVDAVPDYNFFIYVSDDENGLLNTFFLPGPTANSDERLTSVGIVPPEAGSGFVMAGYVSSPTTNQQDLYVLKVFRDLEKVEDLNLVLQGPPRTVTSSLSPITLSRASVFPSKNSGFLLLGDQNSEGNDDIFLTKVDNTLANAWQSPHESFSFGGAGNDLSGGVVETSDGRILLCGTMVLGDVIGQKKVVLMNLAPNGLFVE